jgi:hypothetical protein
MAAVAVTVSPSTNVRAVVGALGNCGKSDGVPVVTIESAGREVNTRGLNITEALEGTSTSANTTPVRFARSA